MRLLKRILLLVFLLAMTGLTAFLILGPGIVESGRNIVTQHEPYAVSDDAQALHDTLVIGDWHADSLLWNRDLLERSERGHVDLPRLREGNVAIQVFTAVTKSPAGQNYESNSAETRDNITSLAMIQLWPPRTWRSLLHRALYQADRLHDLENRDPGAVKIIRNEADLDSILDRRASGEKIVGAILGIEGAHALEGKLDNLARLRDAGYRLVGLHHFFDNLLGGSLHGLSNRGLSEYGRQVVTAVAESGMILDLAHSSPQVAMDVVSMTDIPLIVSHTGIHGKCPVVRNFNDDLMQQIVASGGVVGIGYWADVTCDDSPAGIAATIKAAIDLLGENHVSLGSDYDGSVTTSFDTSELAALTHELLKLEISESAIRKVMGENMLRVLRQRLK